MKEFIDSIGDWFKERNNSPVYVVFFLASLFWNWKSQYVLFFEDEQFLRGSTKLEYSMQYSRTLDSLSTNITLYGIPILDNPIATGIANLFILFFVPILVTYFVIWWLPYIHQLAHKKHLTFVFARKREFDQQQTKYLKEKTGELSKVKDETVRQTQVLMEIAEENEKQRDVGVPLEHEWEREYFKMKKSGIANNFSDLFKLVYEFGGRIKNMHGKSYISTEVLAYAHANGLIEYKEGTSQNIVELTEKGKFFIRHHIEEGQQVKV